MGIFFYIYFLLFNKIKLFKLFFRSTDDIYFSTKKKVAALQYEFFFFFFNKKVKLNFFKRKNGFKLFFQKNKINFSSFFTKNEVSSSKNWFIFIYLVCYFFSISNVFNIYYSTFFTRTKPITLLSLIIQFFFVLCSIEDNARPVYFINFIKWSDFFSKHKHFFFTGLKFKQIYSDFFSTGDLNSIAIPAGQIIASDLQKNKAELWYESSPAKILPLNYLFLFNSFFSVNKKFFFLRNNEIFNKSRYSRNRQTYRTGVFWCIWLTVLTVIGLYFYFYVFLIKFTYIWIFFFIFILSFFFYYFRSKIEKHIFL